MVTIVDIVKRSSREGNEFVALIVQGELEMLTSKSGNLYAAARKASIPSTLEFEAARLMIGKELPGSIEKVECAPYEHFTPEGEILQLNHRWQFVPENQARQQQKEVLYLQDLAHEVG
ncbi:hypothetical protein [Maribellus sp. YY47]|uniref:hypothetical protein n=1 Tax=Maribellus sp. YY47 TaxID=2929486 RepID=UPI002000EA1C|nr:hypothetical protein [Maribellus sp. YY47]MCK3683972.1 hypothetical protein [Maribellus sp. YY47]